MQTEDSPITEKSNLNGIITRKTNKNNTTSLSDDKIVVNKNIKMPPSIMIDRRCRPG